ncbi:hypothetical protein HPB50_008654 [Hyalomma asiaticum]|uniref:Uncharacterized protein n=1 Tax=Hyalomma asiaticum TaxID=266040 RepID=A0ACB7TGL8_HYAAI|nr:hypothetical protein HPB50_008654 [Hyalomma asiaticum]
MGMSFSRKRCPAQQLRPVREVTPFMMPDDVLKYNERPLLCAVEQLSNALNRSNPGEPGTIFRHDMDGNYKEDRFIHGSDQTNAYRFHHWQTIDTSIDYSHHVDATPPSGWASAGHLHGIGFTGSSVAPFHSALLKDTETFTSTGQDIAFVCRAGNATKPGDAYLSIVASLYRRITNGRSPES